MMQCQQKAIILFTIELSHLNKAFECINKASGSVKEKQLLQS